MLLGAGAVGSALGVSLSWLCCLPIIAAVASTGAAALSAHLALLRPLLTALSLGLLAIAFARAYGPRREEGCATEACAVAPNRLRQRLVVWIVTFVTAALLTVESWSSRVVYWSIR